MQLYVQIDMKSAQKTATYNILTKIKAVVMFTVMDHRLHLKKGSAQFFFNFHIA